MLRDVSVLFAEADPSRSTAPSPASASSSASGSLLDDSVTGRSRAQSSAFLRERGGPSAAAGRRQCLRGSISGASFVAAHSNTRQQQHQQQQPQSSGAMVGRGVLSADGSISVVRAGEAAQLWRTGDRRLVASASVGNERWRFSCPALFVEGTGATGTSASANGAGAGAGASSRRKSAAGHQPGGVNGDASRATLESASVRSALLQQTTSLDKALSPRNKTVDPAQPLDLTRPHGVWIAAIDRATFGSNTTGGSDAGPVNTGGSALVVLDPTLAGLPRQQSFDAGTRFLPSCVVRLLSISPTGILVILDDGSVFETDPRLRRLHRLSRADQLIESDNVKASWRHVWCELCSARSGEVAVIQALQRDDADAADFSEVRVLVTTFDTTGTGMRLAEVEQIVVPYCGGNANVRGRRRALSCSFDANDSQLAILWDDGAFDVWANTLDLLAAGAGRMFDASLLLSRRGPSGLVSVENGYISFVGANTVAVIMSTISRQRRTSRESHPPLYETDVQLWDTSFGTLRARRVVASSTVQAHDGESIDVVGADCIDPMLAGILVDVAVANLRGGLSTNLVEANLAIAFERAVMLVSIVGAPVSLANVLSTSIAASSSSDAVDDNATTVSVTLDLDRFLRKAFDSKSSGSTDTTVAKTQASLAPEAAVSAATRDLCKRIDRSNAEEADAILKLSSKQETPSTADFWKVFLAFAKKRLIEEAHARHASRGNVVEAISANDSIPLLAAHEEDEWDLTEFNDQTAPAFVVDAESAVRAGKASLVKRLDVSQAFVAAVLDRCLGGHGGFITAAGTPDDNSAYFSKPIRFLVRHRVVGLHSRPALPHRTGADPLQQVLPSALKAQDLDLIASFLQHVLDLSAVDLVRLISFFLSESSSGAKVAVSHAALREFAHARLDTSSASAHHGAGGVDDSKLAPIVDDPKVSRALEFFLDCIVVLPLNDIAAQHVLKYLSLDVVLRLLTYLLGWFKLHALYSRKFMQQVRRGGAREQRDGKHTFGAPTPELGDIVTWLSLVLDAHFAELVLVRDCHKMLHEIHACLGDHIALCERVEGLAGLLEVFLHHKPIPQNKRSDYVIEPLRL